jgi:hypothetical protein
MPYVATYDFGTSVALGPRNVDASTEDGIDEFVDELRARHALGLGLRLQPVIASIERRHSTQRVTSLSESRGAIRGRLHVSHYLARRQALRTLPRRYPVLVTRTVPETPENVLAMQAMGLLARAASRSPFPNQSAEGTLARAQYVWLRSRMRRYPWSDVRRRDHPSPQLLSAIDWRVRRRQTGNESAYTELLDWWGDFSLDARLMGRAGIDRVTQGILAFPPGDFFWDRVFEVFVLTETSRSLRAGDCTLLRRRPLHERHRGPVETWRDAEGRQIDIWFQRAAPAGSSSWTYEQGGPLRGIPDVVIESPGRPTVLIDAKYRASRQSRSDEIYKMLGYAENFRSLRPFTGILVFPGADSSLNLAGPDDGKLTLIDTSIRQESAELGVTIRHWLAAT